MRDPEAAAPRLWTWALDFLLLFAAAGVLIWPIFRIEYQDTWGSIESTFISDARYLNRHWPHPEWQPNWYCGTRFDYIYPPALRYGPAIISRATGRSEARAYHVYIWLLYCAGIAGVYLLVRTGSGSRWWGIWSAAAAALISPSLLFLSHFRADYKASYYMPVRLTVLVRYGEGPHISAFGLLPIALALAWYGLRRGRAAHLAAAAAMCALVVTHNFYGATSLAIFFSVLVWAVWLAEQDRLVWARAAGITALAWGLTAFWLTPSYMQVTLRNMRLVSLPGHSWSVALAAVVAAIFLVISYRWAKGRPEKAWTVFVGGSLALFALNVLGQYYIDFRVMGEPERLAPELDLAIILGMSVVLGWLAGRANAPARAWVLPPRVTAGAAVVLALLTLVPAKGYVRRAWRLLPHPDDPRQHIEWRISEWVHHNLPGVRTLATGSVRFWYNAWHDMPQLGGGSEQGLLNLQTAFAYSHVTAHETADAPIAYLQAMGTGAIIVHDETSVEPYHDYVNPKKFEGALEKLYDDGEGNRIYRVPRRYPHLARVVDTRKMRLFRMTGEELDWDQVQAYVETIERGSDSYIGMQRLGQGTIRVRARLREGESILVQETYDPAWRAYEGDRSLRLDADVLGFQLIEPGPGEHEILLRFETPLENKVGRAIFAMAMVTAMGLAARGLARRQP